MKNRFFRSIIVFFLLLGFVLGTFGPGIVFAQTNTVVQNKKLLTMDELDKLVGPIALYPDEIIPHILTASTVPLEVIQAARYLKNKGGKVDEIPSTDWDPSVKALLKFPEVLNMMDQKLSWTEQLGDAVIAQQKDVMDAIQRFRKTAYGVGNLTTTPQQKVVVDKEVIKIVPSDPQVVYVPQYDPQEVVVQNNNDWVAPLITFGVGLMIGNWIGYRQCNWYDRNIFVDPYYYPYYRYRRHHRYYRRYPRRYYRRHNGRKPYYNWRPGIRARNHYNARMKRYSRRTIKPYRSPFAPPRKTRYSGYRKPYYRPSQRRAYRPSQRRTYRPSQRRAYRPPQRRTYRPSQRRAYRPPQRRTYRPKNYRRPSYNRNAFRSHQGYRARHYSRRGSASMKRSYRGRSSRRSRSSRRKK